MSRGPRGEKPLAEPLDPLARAALAEAITGNMSTHIAYCTRTPPPPPDPMDPTAIPVARGIDDAQFHRAWRATFSTLSALNRVLLSPAQGLGP